MWNQPPKISRWCGPQPPATHLAHAGLGGLGLRFAKGSTPTYPPSCPHLFPDQRMFGQHGGQTKRSPSHLITRQSMRYTRTGRGGWQGGFTLLEVLVAALILSVSLLAVHQAFNSALLTSRTTDKLWRVLRFVNQELARIERDPQSPRVAVTQGVYPPEHPFANHRWRRSVTNYQPFPGVTIKRVAFRVEWGDLETPRSYTATLNLPAN